MHWTKLLRPTSLRARCTVRHYAGAVERMLSQPTPYTHKHLFTADDQVTPGISRSEYAERRKRFGELLNETLNEYTQIFDEKLHVLAIVPAPFWQYVGPHVPYEFRQSSHFLYLSGVLEPGAMLCAWRLRGENMRFTLFVAPRDAKSELWDGPKLGVDDGVKFTGIDEVMHHNDFDTFIKRFDDKTATFLNTPSFVNHAHAQQALMSNANLKFVTSPYHLIDRLRVTKSCAEQELMRKAVRIGADAVTATMRRAAHIKPLTERQVVGLFVGEALSRGAHMAAYPPVVGAGTRANIIHYMRCDMAIEDNDMILMDAGIDYHGYVSDITRTWPVRGKVTTPQRDLLHALNEVHQNCIKYAAEKRPLVLNELHEHFMQHLGVALVNLGILDPNWEAGKIHKILLQMLERVCPHHVSHHLGMDVHDCESVSRAQATPPNSVITIEPGAYFAERDEQVPKHFRGIGLRIEDDFIIHESGIENLSAMCPSHYEQIAALLNS